MRILTLALSMAALALAGRAQSGGAPGIRYTCTPDDMDRFGLTCTARQPCPVYVELAAAESVGGRIVLTGNLHTDGATLYSLLLMSDDSGQTWTEPHERIPSATLDAIQFVDLQTGWVSGQTVANLPRDPFLLLTSDGGKSWKRVAVSEEPKTGAIEAFWFESRTRGVLLIDLVRPNETGGRHELYRSMTGGESWALEEVSAKPLRLPRPPAAEPAWRVRAEAANYLLERNGGGGRWERVAQFPVQAGACRPEETTFEPSAEAPPPSAAPLYPVLMIMRGNGAWRP